MVDEHENLSIPLDEETLREALPPGHETEEEFQEILKKARILKGEKTVKVSGPFDDFFEAR